MSEMLFYVLVALLPVAAYSGYRAGKKSSDPKEQQTSGLSRRYFVGLNFVLNEQPDKAIDTFIKMLEVDSETVETHLALGNLFRKRGEVDRAIRFHQNLIARPSLPADVRNLSLLELGLDYMAAGLLDRAESIFNELLSEPQHKAVSLRQLMLIYQQTRDWDKAVKVAEQLQQTAGEDHVAEIANFYCELAEKQISQQQMKPAWRSLRKSLNIDPGCVRANILRGNLSLQEQQYKQALKYYRELLRQNPGFIAEVIDKIENCFLELKDQKGYRLFLQQSLDRGAGVSVVIAYAKLMQHDQDDRQAAEFIVQKLQDKPSLKGLLKLIELHLANAQESARPNLEVLFNIVFRLYESKPVYRCNHCGFSSKALFWQCPSCKYWGAVNPIFGLEGE